MYRKQFFLILSFSLFILSCSSLPDSKLTSEYVKIGDSYVELKKYKEAENYYQKGMADKSLEKICIYKLGKLYQKTSEWQKSADCFNSLVQNDPDNISLKENLAYDYGMNGDFQKALDVYSEIEKTELISQKNLENIIVILIAADEKEKARQKVDELSEKFPDSTKISVFLQKLEPAVEN